MLTLLLVLATSSQALLAPPRAPRTTRRQVFSGIVEEMGTVASLTREKEMTLWDESIGLGTELVVRGAVALEDAYVGCSIAVDGVCVTATELGDDFFTVGLAPETLRRTTLGTLKEGSRVNLERSLAGRNSGHYVQGHVDGVASIAEKWRDGESLWLRFVPPPELLPFVVEKGYVAVDGTSLTVCDVDDSSFTVMLVAHTQSCIVLPSKHVGDSVNVEVDVMSKYAQSALSQVAARLQSLEARVADLERCQGTACTGLD
mmetsp:Transcript_3088/g.9431  ORF Transcript_3088/g.9431 Transcript_3088/m.9431 type:complete len:259 (-) Transcript_3088:1652-2428(-)